MSIERLQEAKKILKAGGADAKKLLADIEINPPQTAAEVAAVTEKVNVIESSFSKTAKKVGLTVLKAIGAVVVGAAAAVATAATSGLAAHIAIPVAAAVIERIFDKGVDTAANYKSPTPFATTPKPY